MKRVITLSRAWIAALVFGITLTGCGGGSSGDSGTQSSGSLSTMNGSALLSWNAPTERQNGDPIEEIYDLSGYVISYGQDPGNLDKTVRIDDAYQTEYSVENLEEGTWYFTVQAEDDNGLMSAPSDQVNKTIRG